MSENGQNNALPGTGLQAIHANRLEDLRQLVVWMLRRQPLAPLQAETFLVQSNGIAQWLRLALAELPDATDELRGGLGVAAVTDFFLPSRFVWQAYRAVLGPEAVPQSSPFDKSHLLWRLYALLPEVCQAPPFEPLARFLDGPEPEQRCFQLAERLADLFDQYQVFRADWLAAWEQGEDSLITANGARQALAPEQCWQPALWRRLLESVGDGASASGRAQVHERFMQAVNNAHGERPAGLPSRLVVFGVSSMPRQTLEVLAALGRWCQVLLCVHNPCEFYWADIISDRELLRARRKRGRQRPGMPDQLEMEQMHLHAHPLLAAWGKQGRDYIRLLDEFDDPQCYRGGFESAGQRIDLFDAPAETHLLGQIQSDIQQLRPISEIREQSRTIDPKQDASLRFHSAHSPLREVEILHDQLLAAFNADASLRPRDVIVMVPDINQYAASIEAVFGRYDPDDVRHIPFTISDQGQRHHVPVVVALEALLGLPESRLGVSEVMTLLEVPAVRERFGLAEADLGVLLRWIRGANIRWGLDAQQRAALDLPDGMSANTWLFGLERMLLGYCMGEASAWRGVEPYAEVAGLSAGLAGRLAEFVQRLRQAFVQLAEPGTPSEWVARLQWLDEQMLAELDGHDALAWERLLQTVDAWFEACQEAGMAEQALPINIVRECWLEGLDEGGLSQRFLAGKVNFATLMPMRAIPFRHVCLLGLNDGDYPRSRPAPDFDLMADQYRPGDRSRREDDRYLFLEALLSARDRLSISWVGRSVADNSACPPSVLVAQLRDHLDAGWQVAGRDDQPSLAAELTLEHPLQPFSPRYFPTGQTADVSPGRLFTYDREWRAAHDGSQARALAVRLAAVDVDQRPDLTALVRFFKSPPEAFYRQRLGVHFGDDSDNADDVEPFGFDGLRQWQLREELIHSALLASDDPAGLSQRLEQARGHLAGRGDLGLGALRDIQWQALTRPLPEMHQRYCSVRGQATPASDLALSWTCPGQLEPPVVLEANLGGLWRRGGQLLRLSLSPSKGGSGRQIRLERLGEAWLSHLLAHACGHRLRSSVVFADCSVSLLPLEPEDAAHCLAEWVAAWFEAMQEPLPVTAVVASAWFRGEKGKHGPMAEAAKTHQQQLAQDAGYLRRAWPQFDPDDETLGRWIERLYRPLHDAIDEGDA